MRVLVLSVSAGAGHVRAAQAICAAAETAVPGVQAVHVDVMDHVASGFRTLYSESYIKLVERAPLLWSYLYQRSDRRESDALTDRFRRRLERLNTRRLDEVVDRLRPDAIVCTHFLPAELLARRIRQGIATAPVWVHVTDFDVHGLWLQSGMSGYFVANDEVAARLIAHGIAPEAVEVTGIAVMPRFAEPPDRADAASALGIDPTRPTLLVMSGGAGVGGIETSVEHLAALDERWQLVALAGRNAALLERLNEVAARFPGRVRPMGFTTEVERVMASADLVITKPGGLTTSECLAMHLPMVVVSPIPGQEERNADYLLESGCALKAVDLPSLGFKVKRLLESPARLQQMREAAARIARPDAAAAIVRTVSLEHPTSPASKR